ncbi:acyl-CoA dehydrogenase family protein [Sphingopyxis sp. 550A]
MFDNLTVGRLPPDDEALRPVVRSLVAKIAKVPADRRARSWQAFDADLTKRLGAAGLIGLTLPKKYGGRGLGPYARYVVVEELLAVGAPVAAHWIADRQSAPLILRYGTEAQREELLPRICRGDIYFCIGMSEPGAGSDLASVQTRAVPTSSGWTLNGQKIWTTNGTQANYMIALVRTSGTPTDRHKGLSQILIDLTLPGVTVRPIKDLAGDEHFAEVFFEDVELSADALIGTEGNGWEQVTAELGFERSGPERIYSSIVLLDIWIEHLKNSSRPDSTSLRLAGSFTSRLVTLRAMSIACAAELAAGRNPVAEAALVKDLGTSLEQEIPVAIADDLSRVPVEQVNPELARALTYLLLMSPSFSLRGGTREILRGIIARELGIR